MEIRKSLDTDVGVIAELRVEFYADVHRTDVGSLPRQFTRDTADFIRTHARSGAFHTWLAVDDDQRVGGLVSVLLFPVPPRPDDVRPYDGYVLNMYVRPTHRKLGVGRRLFDTCIASAEQLGVRRFFLLATADGRPLYEEAGFRPNDAWLELPMHRD